jgi:hypothetical protein
VAVVKDGAGGPNGSDPLDAFARRLREALRNAGDPSVRDLERISRDLGNPYSRQTFSQKLNGRSKPDWRFVETLVKACARHAGHDVGKSELAVWQVTHRRFQQELAAVRGDQRERARGAAAVPLGDEFSEDCALYLRRLRDRYNALDHTNALAVSIDQEEAPALPLREIFVPQWVRAQPPQTELPREARRELLAFHRLNRATPEGVDLEQLAREAKAYTDIPRRPVLEVIAERDGSRIVVLGNPGAGKSTLAAYLTLALADLAISDSASGEYPSLAGLAGHVPLLLELRTYAPHAEDREFLDEIGHPHKTGHPGLPRRLLEPYLEQGGPALVVFDGLDEVFDRELREDIKWRIKRFASDYPGVRVIVTSRATGYEPERHILDQGGFAHYTLQDLEPPQVDEFVRGFYRETSPGNPAKSEELTARWLKAVTSSATIAELAGNPMLLTALALLGLRGNLPSNRAALLKHIVGVLVNRWDTEKYLSNYLRSRAADSEIMSLDAEDKTEMLGLVARRIQEGNKGAGGLAGNYLSRDALIDVFISFYNPQSEEERRGKKAVARALADQFRERDYILAKFGHETFGFVHRALLDYLAADDINAQFSSQKIYPDHIEKLYREHSTAPEWQEVLLLLAGMIRNPTVFEDSVTTLLKSNPLWYLGSDPLPRHVLLAIRCLGETRHPEQARAASRAVSDALITLLETISGASDYPLAVALTQALERDVLPILSRLGRTWAGRPAYETWYLCRGQFLRGDTPGFAATAAADIYVALIGNDGQARDRLYTLARWADSEMVRGAALEALARNWHRAPETAELLIASAAGDRDAYVRRVAVGTLAAHWRSDQATHDLLCERATCDESSAVRATAIRWLASGWREPATADLLRAVGADTALRGEVRAVAVAELAAGWHDEEQTARWLWERAEDDDARVRASAAHALAGGWHDDPRTRQWLCERTARDCEPSPKVRVTAVRALAAGWPELAETLALLKAKASPDGDDDTEVRQAAVEALAAGWQDDPGISGWLRERAGTEPDDDVRCALAQALASYWPKDAATAGLLQKLAEDDDDWYVRATAVQALASIRVGQPRTGMWLRERAAGDAAPLVRQVALGAVAAGWQADQKTQRLLMDRVADAREDLIVRTAAVRALAAGWREAPTLELLRTVGEGDVRTGAMRRVALQSVAVCWRDHEQTRPWLRERAIGDKSPAVRRTALQLLAADMRWHDDEDTVRLLRESAIGDAFPEARKAAIRTLSAGWRDDPATAEWLRNDAFAIVDRQGKLAVIRTLATDWHDDPATPRWLRDRASADPDPDVQREAVHWLSQGWPDKGMKSN